MSASTTRCGCGHTVAEHTASSAETGCTACGCRDTASMVVADLRWRPIVWTCPKCETDHRTGSPDAGCPDCGYRVAS